MEWVTIQTVERGDGSAYDVHVGTITIRCTTEADAWALKFAIDQYAESINPDAR